MKKEEGFALRGEPHRALEDEACSPKILQKVAEAARQLFDGAKGSHAWDHTLRVCELCRRIGVAEGADMDVLLTAAYLHDIGRGYQDASSGAICHARKGVELAYSVVETLPLSDAQKQNVYHCIESHRFRGKNTPETVEAKVLFDADKLDAIGAVGVARAFLFAGEVGARLHNSTADMDNTRPYSSDDTGYREYYFKLRHIAQRILTPAGRMLAKDRHRFMEAFFNRLIVECEGRR